MTGIRDEGTHDCNLGYYDTFDLPIILKKRKLAERVRTKEIQSTNIANKFHWKRERSKLFACIKKRRADILIEKLINEAEKVISAKDKQTVLALSTTMVEWYLENHEVP